MGFPGTATEEMQVPMGVCDISTTSGSGLLHQRILSGPNSGISMKHPIDKSDGIWRGTIRRREKAHEKNTTIRYGCVNVADSLFVAMY